MPANGNVSCGSGRSGLGYEGDTCIFSHVTLVMNYITAWYVVLREYVTVMAAGVVVMSCAAEVAR